MSAIHITAEAGHTYLTHSGRRLRVKRVVGSRIEYFDLDEEFHLVAHRASFERMIESVLS